MNEYLMVEYDEESDTLYLGTRSPYVGQQTEELEYGVIARLNPETRGVENLEVLFFSRRFKSGESVAIPVVSHFDLPAAS